MAAVCALLLALGSIPTFHDASRVSMKRNMPLDDPALFDQLMKTDHAAAPIDNKRDSPDEATTTTEHKVPSFIQLAGTRGHGHGGESTASRLDGDGPSVHESARQSWEPWVLAFLVCAVMLAIIAACACGGALVFILFTVVKKASNTTREGDS
eukprot:TRINITY_DN19592_c0_g1_i2.p1 TRINITY_DN19592_c0_g1~~TRINITY_DN19592_c0_g1_i2.p1  ORF type:complete len:153 (-),score=23.07 TRINITY_DN19592_c0_g1_i2:116-574(-)